MGTVNALDPQTKGIFSFSNTGALHGAIQDYGYVPVHVDGSPFITQSFKGGYVLDGAPINVYIEGLWYAGQKEALQPEWDAGRIPRPSNEILNPVSIPVVPMPPDVAANDELYNTGTGILSSIPNSVLYGAAAFVAWRFLK